MPNRILTILIALFLWGQVLAQSNIILPNYRHYTLRNGLSQMQVMKMFQDSRGYIWIGTKGGLNCFDGQKFRIYTKKYNQLSDDYIFDIKEDSSGRIWASTSNGIFYIDGEKLKYFEETELSGASLAPDQNGRVWYIGSGRSFKNHFGYIENDKFNSIGEDLPGPSFTVYKDIFFSQSECTLLFSIDSVLYSFKDNIVKKVYTNQSFIDFIPTKNGKCYFLDSNDIKSFNLNIYKNDSVQVVAQVADGKFIRKPLLTDTIFFTSSLLPISAIGLTPDTIYYDSFEGLQTNQVLMDRNKQLWVGSEEGLYQLFGDGFTTYQKEFLPQVWSVAEDFKGNMWFSSFQFGLSKIEHGKISSFTDKEINNPAKYFYFHPSVDKYGRLYFPNALGILKTDGSNFKQFSDVVYLTTFYDKDKDLLWGGSKKQATVFDIEGNIIRNIGEKQGLNVGQNVLAIAKDSLNHFWLAGGRGLARYNWETDKLQNYNQDNRKSAVTGIVAIHNDYKGRTWFGSNNGLLWYDAKKDSLIKLDREDLLDPVNLISSIDSSWLIVSQPYGIYLMDLQEYYHSGKMKLQLFNETNGFLGIEPGQDGAFKDSKGNIWMTTSTELVKLDPKRIKIGSNSLKVRIDKCNGKHLPYNALRIELPVNQNSAIITFGTICFNRPNLVQYSWKLESDTAWSAWQEEDYAVISGLKDGQTKVSVRAKIKGLPLPELAQTDVVLKVRIAIYKQPWFFMTLFSLISFFGIIFLALALLKMKNANREAKMFHIQAIQSQMNPHFIFNVLASLQSMILKANISKANDYLVKLADLIRGFLEASAGTGVLKSPQLNDGQVSIAAELYLLKEFVDFQQVINPERFDFVIYIDEQIVPESELIPPMLIQPFIENAIRHGILPSKNKGNLLLSIRKTNEALVIEIRDNGVGIEKANQMIRKSTMRYISRGSELTINRVKLLNQLGFKIEIKSESNDESTCITIKLYK